MAASAKDTVRPARGASNLYERDFHAWARQQADLVRSGRFDALDRDRLVEEIESLGNSEDRSLQSSYKLIAMHLLKMIYQPQKRTESWTETIIRERDNVQDMIVSYPGLKPKRQGLFETAFPKARNLAAKETGLPLQTFPVVAPFTREQAEDDDFWP